MGCYVENYIDRFTMRHATTQIKGISIKFTFVEEWLRQKVNLFCFFISFSTGEYERRRKSHGFCPYRLPKSFALLFAFLYVTKNLGRFKRNVYAQMI